MPDPDRKLPRLDGPDRVALLLDFDGTLVDIAPTPELVIVPDTLRDSLARLHDRLDGALAIVTGRPLDQVDHFLAGIPLAVAAEHGAVIRRRPDGDTTAVDLPPIPAAWLDEADRAAASQDGVRVERKKTGFVLHYRAAPDAGPALHTLLTALIGDDTDRYHVLPAKMAWEIRAHGADKGSAVQTLMAEPPFAGRRPVFIGDDVTDQHGIDAAVALGGLGLMVPDAFGEPAQVRDWLRRLADGEAGLWGA
jgi:trehalose 6-phosphate phosphatase